jgi:hypothetical protein
MPRTHYRVYDELGRQYLVTSDTARAEALSDAGFRVFASSWGG